MKIFLIIPPVLSLAIAAGWLGSQRVVISGLETETAELRERIRTRASGSGEAGERSLATRMKEESKDQDEEIDWKGLAGKLARANRGGMPDMRAMMELQTALMEMDADELLAELDRIEGMDLGQEARQTLDGMLIGMLAQKDPKVMLDRYMDRVNDDRSGMSWQLSNAFQQWQKEEPVAALAWLDAEIAKGTFESRSLDGRSESRFRFESAAMIGLLSTDPATARERVLAFPEDQRLGFFNQGMLAIQRPGSEKAYAELVRSVLPEDQQGAAYKQSVGHLMRQGGLEKVDRLISEIDASDREREAIVDHALSQRVQTLGWEGKLDRAAVDEMREWASTQSPGRVDTITGEALGKVWGNRSKLEDRVRLIEALHDEGAGDDLIVSFIGSRPRGSEARELMGPLVERIADDAKRQQVIDRLAGKPMTPAPGDNAVEVVPAAEVSD
jgi:hypothetical protein